MLVLTTDTWLFTNLYCILGNLEVLHRARNTTEGK